MKNLRYKLRTYTTCSILYLEGKRPDMKSRTVLTSKFLNHDFILVKYQTLVENNHNPSLKFKMWEHLSIALLGYSHSLELQELKFRFSENQWGRQGVGLICWSRPGLPGQSLGCCSWDASTSPAQISSLNNEQKPRQGRGPASCSSCHRCPVAINSEILCIDTRSGLTSFSGGTQLQSLSTVPNPANFSLPQIRKSKYA